MIPKYLLDLRRDDTNSSGEDKSEKKVTLVKKKSKPDDEESNEIHPFWKTKDAFTTIKFSEDALEYNELVPPLKQSDFNTGREWWFFNQVDFQPFTGDEVMPPT